jgi:hypothetical protein
MGWDRIRSGQHEGAWSCAMLSRSELLDKAAEYERQMQSANDPKKREAYRQLRDMWIELANDSDGMSEDQFDELSPDLAPRFQRLPDQPRRPPDRAATPSAASSDINGTAVRPWPSWQTK